MDAKYLFVHKFWEIFFVGKIHHKNLADC